MVARLIERASRLWSRRGDVPVRDGNEWAYEKTQREFETYRSRSARVTQDALFSDTYDLDMSAVPDAESVDHKWRLMTHVVGGMRDLAERHGVTLLLVAIPSGVDVCETFKFQVARDRFPAYRRSRITDAIVAIARAQNVDVVDLFPAFADGPPCELYFQGSETHWNEAGQALAAEVVGRKLESILTGGPGP